MLVNKDWINFGVGMTYMVNGRHERAENQFKKLLAQNPSYGYAYAQLGYLRKRIGKLDEANSFFDKAIKNLPNNEMGIYQRCMMYVEQGDSDAALNSFTKVLNLNPSNIDALINMALVYGRKGDFDKAEQIIIVAYEKDLEKKDGFARLGWLKTQDEDWAGAFEIMNKDWVAKRLSPEWQVNFAQILGHSGEFDRAMEIVNQAYTMDHTIKDGFARLGWIIALNQNWDEALQLMNIDYRNNRISDDWQINLAQIFGRLNDWSQAVELIEKAYAYNKDIKDGFARLGWIKAEDQDWNGALYFTAIDMKKNRLSSEWKINYAMILVFIGEHEKALKEIEDLYSQDKSLKDGYSKVGWAYYLSSWNDKILRYFLEKDASLKRLSISGKIIMAYAMSLNEELKESCALIDQIYSENETLNDGYAVLGWSQFLNGKKKLGLSLMNVDYRLHRLSTVWMINYSYCLASVGQYQKAQRLFKEVMNLEPHREKFRIGIQLRPLEIMSRNRFNKLINYSE